MPKVTIDGIESEVPNGTTILEQVGDTAEHAW